MKSFTEHFIRVWIHTSKISKVSRNISYVYEFIRRRFHTRIKSNAFEKIRVCKIPWMILHNDTRIKIYTYEKLHVWTVTRMKNYTYEKLHVLNIEFWLVHCYTRIDSFTQLLIRVCFLTWNFSYVEPLIGAFCPLRPTIVPAAVRWKYMVTIQRRVLKIYLFIDWNHSWIRCPQQTCADSFPVKTRVNLLIFKAIT